MVNQGTSYKVIFGFHFLFASYLVSEDQIVVSRFCNENCFTPPFTDIGRTADFLETHFLLFSCQHRLIFSSVVPLVC